MRRFLVDVDVVLDVLLDRRPHSAGASALWSARERGLCRLALSAHALTTVYYLAAKQRDAAFARTMTTDLASLFEIAAVDEPVIHRALAIDLGDFEDAVVCAAAERSGCDAIVTRNLRHFRKSPLPAIDPTTALAWIAADE